MRPQGLSRMAVTQNIMKTKYTGAPWQEIKAHVHALQADCLVLANNSTNSKETDIHGYEYPRLKDKQRKPLPSEDNTNAA